MALEREDLVELVDLAERRLAALRALREESERQTGSFGLLVKLASLERSQYS
jgi:hypothetical protein